MTKLKPRHDNSRARTRWLLAYTLTTNPALRTLRKSYLKEMRELHERIARLYSIDSTAMGKMVTEMNRAFIPVGNNPLEHMANNLSGTGASWNQLLGMSAFLQKLQNDLDMQQQSEHAVDNGTISDNGDVKVHVKSPQNMWKRAALTALTSGTKSAADEQDEQTTL